MFDASLLVSCCITHCICSPRKVSFQKSPDSRCCGVCRRISVGPFDRGIAPLIRPGIAGIGALKCHIVQLTYLRNSSTLSRHDMTQHDQLDCARTSTRNTSTYSAARRGRRWLIIMCELGVNCIVYSGRMLRNTIYRELGFTNGPGYGYGAGCRYGYPEPDVP